MDAAWNAGNARGADGAGSLEDAQPRIIKDKMTDQIRIEDTLVDYMEIINGLNAKMNNHIHSTKVSLRDLESKSQQAPPGGSYLSSGDPSMAKLD